MKQHLLLSLIFLLYFFLFSTPVSIAQKRNIKGCTYDGKSIDPEKLCSQLRFQGNDEAEAIIDKMLTRIGLQRNFVVMECPGIQNCMAVNIDRIPYIIYDRQFLDKFKGHSFSNSKINVKDWAATSILAHEIGHHLNMHTLQEGGSRPHLELEADEFSGFILQKLGATLSQAQQAMKSSIISDEGSRTHPPRQERLTAIQKGWLKAAESEPKPAPQPKETEQKDETKNLYRKAITEADEAFDEEEYRTAMLKYQRALALKPNDRYASIQLKNAKMYLAEEEAIEINDFDEPIPKRPTPRKQKTSANRTSIQLAYRGDFFACQLRLAIKIGDQVVNPTSNPFTINNIPIGNQSYMISGQIQCTTGYCNAVGAGSINVSPNSTIYIYWNNNAYASCAVSLANF